MLLRTMSSFILVFLLALNKASCHFFFVNFLRQLIPSKRISNITVGNSEAVSLTACNLECINKKHCISTLFTINKNKCVLLSSFFKEVQKFGETTENDKSAKVIETRAKDPCSLLPCPMDVGCFNNDLDGHICVTNIALGKPVAQLGSYDRNSHPEKAVDGNLSGKYPNVAITPRVLNAWWRVDLGKQAVIKSVTIYIRDEPRCWFRINPFDIRVGDSLVNYGRNNKLCFQAGVFASIEERFKRFDCQSKAVGRYVSVHLNRRQYLELAEVQVYGYY